MTAAPLAPTDALVVDEAKAWPAADAWDVIDRLAHRTREAAFADPTAPRRVAVFAENAATAVLAHVGGLRSGASVVAVSAHLNGTDAADLLERADVAQVVAGPRTREAAREAAALATGRTGRPCEVRCWTDPDWDPWLAAAPAGPPADDRPIVPNLLFTSGTTGRPKATELPPNVFPRRDSWARFLEATRANRFVGLGRHLVVAPLHHTGPLNAVRALAAGTPIGVLGRFDPARMVEALEAWSIASTTVVPTHLSRLLALPRAVREAADVSTLRLVFLTGAACPIDVKRAVIDWWGPVILEAYGATEVGVTCSITSEDWLAHPGSVGRSVPPYRAIVLDEAGHELPAGQEGRLSFVDGTGRGVVYHGDPTASDSAHARPGVFTLGEIGRVDEDGWVYVTDRFADLVVTGGVNVYPAEAEQVLVTHPEVADVAGVGLPHPDLGEQLVALVVPRDPASPPAVTELDAWCRERLSRYKCPREIRLVETLHRSELGKLDKRGLRARQLDPT